MHPKPPFLIDRDPAYAEPQPVAGGIARLTCKNPSPFTYHGTNSYLLEGKHQRAVLDPGPVREEHLEKLIAFSPDVILVTHSHADHSPASRPLKDATGAEIIGFGPYGAGIEGGLDLSEAHEGVDTDFVPNRTMGEGDVIDLGEMEVTALHTPGHMSNHICFWLDAPRILISGDHIMSWATSIVAPPEGDMAAYMRELARVEAMEIDLILPAHGAPVENPRPLVSHLLQHRREREAEVLSMLAKGHSEIMPIVETLYAELPKPIHRLAAQSIWAHMIKLVDEGRVVAEPEPTLTASYSISA